MDATIPDLGAAVNGQAAHTKPLVWRQNDRGFEAWLEGKDEAEIEALEAGGRELYRETLRKLRRGVTLEIEVLFRVPNTHDRLASRREALQMVRLWLGLSAEAPPLTIASAVSLIGEAYWQHIDNLCLLSHAVRDPKFDPDARDSAGNRGDYPRHMLPAYLDAHYPTTTLYDALERLDWYSTREDPRMTRWTEEEFAAVLRKIDERRNLSPLAVIAGSARESFVLSMACQLHALRTPKRS